MNVTVSQIKGPSSGSSFRVGITEIQYQATDLNGNKSPDCVFFVVVEGNVSPLLKPLLIILNVTCIYLPRQNNTVK